MRAILLSTLLALPLAAQPPGPFAPPFAVSADGAALDRPGEAEPWVVQPNGYPWLGDFDGDGKPDLLVGRGGGSSKGALGREGRLRVYRNVGEAGAPRFGAPTLFDSLVPTGRIPEG